MSNPTVSIIMSTYNRASLLPRAIDSIIIQTFQDWKLTVIDDCSPDSTPTVMAKYVGQDKRIYYRRNKENIGSGKSKNPIMVSSAGKYIAILDDDDWWMPIYLEELVAALENNPDSPISYSDIIRVDTSGTYYYWDCSKGKPFPNILPSATLMRGDTFRKLGGWDMVNFCRGYHAEADYYIRVGGTSKFIHIAKPLVYATISPDAMSANPKANVEALQTLIRKHSDSFSRKTLALHYLRIALHSQEGKLGNRRYFLKAILTYPFLLEAWGGLILASVHRKLFLVGYELYRKLLGYPPPQKYG